MIPSLVLAVAVIVTTEFMAVGLLFRFAIDFGVTVDQAAHTISVFALFAACLGAILTLIAGRLALRLALPGCLLLFACGNMIPAMFPGFIVLLGARALQGSLLPPIISLASVAAAHFKEQGGVKGQDGAARAIAQVNLGTIIGAVIALPLGVVLADALGTRVLFGLLGAATIMAAGAVFLFTPVDLQPPRQSWGAQLRILRYRHFLCHLMLSMLLFAAMFSTYSYIAAYMETQVGLTAREAAVALFGFWPGWYFRKCCCRSQSGRKAYTDDCDHCGRAIACRGGVDHYWQGKYLRLPEIYPDICPVGCGACCGICLLSNPRDAFGVSGPILRGSP